MHTKEKPNFWLILKGYAMILMVLGCCSFEISPYIHTCNVAFVIFAEACFYNEEKYLNKPSEYIINIFKSNWGKYVIYVTMLILFHNIAVKFALHINQPYYSFDETLGMITNAFVFSATESFAYLMWFIAPLIVSCAILALSVTFSEKVSNLIKTKKRKNLVKYISLATLCGILVLLFSKYQTMYYINIAFLMSPVCAVAYFVAKADMKKISKYLNLFVALFFGFLLFVLVEYTGFSVNLAINDYPGKVWFVVLSMLGIYICMYLSKITQKIPYYNQAIAFLGKYWFEIWAFSLIAIKVCDRAYAFITGEKDPMVFGVEICAYPKELLWVYVLAGTFLPALFGFVIDKVKYKINNRSDA